MARQQTQPAKRLNIRIITVAQSGQRFEAATEQALLDAAQGAALNLPHSCKGGNCGACKARLVRGEIHYPNGPPLGLSAAEVAEGLILLCQARARTDLVVETFEVQAADTAILKRLPCRIERAVSLSHDVMGLYLRLPLAEAFTFEAGQYIDILLPDGRRRSFSIASPPHDARPLELHIRRVVGGEFTDRLFQDQLHALLTIEGPLGNFTYRPVAKATPSGMPAEPPSEMPAAPPMLLIGGGTGIAPLISILRHVIENDIPRQMRLFWGVRSEQDLYAQSTLEGLIRRAAALSYTPVLSEPKSAWSGLTGWVHEAAMNGIGDLEAVEVYAAGPPAMIAAIQREYASRRSATTHLHFDSFDYAPDTLERQRMSAATKS